LFVDSAGNVGVGTTAPSSLLQVGSGSDSNAIATFFSATSSSETGKIIFKSNNNFDAGLGIASIYANDAGTVNQNRGNLVFATGLDAAPTEKVRITSTGNVGVGTSNPETKLHVLDTTKSIITVSPNADSGASVDYAAIRFRSAISNYGTPNYAEIVGFTDGDAAKNGLKFLVRNGYTGFNAYEAMRIDSAGTIRFGTTNPFYAYIGAAGDFANVVNNITCATFQRNSGIGTVVQFKIDSNLPGSISCDTVSTSYNTSSDYRLKENVVSLTGAIDRVNQLQVHRFNFISEPDRTVDGFIAHEAQAVVPECATGIKDEVDADGNPVYQGIDQSKLVPLLTAALQEAIAEIAVLKDRVAALEGN
jgi:hypothetical protein